MGRGVAAVSKVGLDLDDAASQAAAVGQVVGQECADQVVRDLEAGPREEGAPEAGSGLHGVRKLAGGRDVPGVASAAPAQ